VQDSNETFIQHLRGTYEEELPPIWALVEIMSFGQLSQWYANTAKRSDRNKVARLYGVDEKVLVSLLHHLTTVRNLCAHHARLWNREFTVTPQLPRSSPEALRRSLWHRSGRKIYNTLALVVFLLDQINPGHHFRQRLGSLILSHEIDDTAMGFPADWKELPLWSGIVI
jgi:abortive infection bacteriophage resistance protein